MLGTVVAFDTYLLLLFACVRLSWHTSCAIGLPRRRRQQKPHARDSDPTQHTDDAEADALGNEDPGDGDTVRHVSWCAACGLLAARDVPAPATKFAVAASSYGRGRFMWRA